MSSHNSRPMESDSNRARFASESRSTKQPQSAANQDRSPKTQQQPKTKLLPIPPQHGAWAFLVVPLLIGLLLGYTSLVTALFAVAWLLAYPANYYLGRAIVIRWRRGNWSRLAKRELRHARGWVILALIPAVVLVVLRPWLLWVGAVLLMLWAVSLWLTRIGHERGASNDLLLVAQASVAVPLMWALDTNTANLGIGQATAATAWWAACICLVYFTGTVIHVKSLIREANDRRWAVGSRVFNSASIAMGFVSPWLLLAFIPAAIRAFAIPKGLRPARVGMVEMVISLLVVIATVLALG